MSPRCRPCAILLLVACNAAPEQDNGLRVTIDSTGRYPIVRSLGDGPTQSASLIAVVGASGGPHEFGSIRSVLLSEEGALYVADPSYLAVSVFDSTGRFVRQLGRDGAGPGEYRDPYSLAWLGQRLALLDPGNARIGLYETPSDWVSSRSVQPISGGQFIRLYRTPPTFWSYAVRTTAVGSEGVFVHHTLAGPTDSVPLLRPATGSSTGRLCNRPDGGISFFSPPFGPVLLQIPTPEGFRALARTTLYRIALLNPQGDTVRVIERDVPLVAVSDAEWAEANADWVSFRAEWPTAACNLGEFPRPAYKPPVVFFFYDDVGRLWVELSTTDAPRYDVFDRNGRLAVTVVGLPQTGGVDPSVAGER